MTTPADDVRAAAPSMEAERWRVVDAIVRAALACEPERRAEFIADACGDDAGLHREVDSLFAYDVGDDGFLERPYMESTQAPLSITVPPTVAARLAAALEGRYAIEREIARGGMASVHLARDLRHDRFVAIKVLREEVARTLGAERFLEEIRVTASLQHPHILPLFDSGDADGLLWFAMPYVDGGTLRNRLEREKRLPADEAVRLAREVADALDHAHARGILHRDIKPENVLLRGGHALVADFGIALALEHSASERLTRTGVTLGTPPYMSPEQASGERALDARVDVYALGAVLHEMLAGEPPVPVWGTPPLARNGAHGRSTALLERRPDVALPLDSAVRRALAPALAERFPSAGAFAEALAASADAARGVASDASHGASVAVPTRRTVGARMALYITVVALAAGLVGGWAISRTGAIGWRPAQGAADVAPSIAPTVVAPVVTGDDDVLTIVDRAGKAQRSIVATRPWTPRFSPDGNKLAYGAFGEGRQTSDIWVLDIASNMTKRLTDDDRDDNDPQWSADSKTVAYSVSAEGGKDIASRRLDGSDVRTLATRDGTQFASDWLRDGSALIVTESSGHGGDILVQPIDGSAARHFAATSADETTARVSPDGRWIAYTSDQSGRAEVYLDSFTNPGRAVVISQGGGIHPVWRGDGQELFFWREDALYSVTLGATNGDVPPSIESMRVLLRASYPGGISTMYDVSPDGQRFVLVHHR